MGGLRRDGEGGGSFLEPDYKKGGTTFTRESRDPRFSFGKMRFIGMNNEL